MTYLKLGGEARSYFVEELVGGFVGTHEDQLNSAFTTKEETNGVTTNSVRSFQLPWRREEEGGGEREGKERERERERYM